MKAAAAAAMQHFGGATLCSYWDANQEMEYPVLADLSDSTNVIAIKIGCKMQHDS